MSRPLRIEFNNAWYHVMNRGRARQAIFEDDSDYHTFLATLGEACRLFKLEVHAYCLMSNHYHMLLKTPEGNLARAMRHINGVYTQRYNRRHDTDGPLFRGRYKAIIVDCDAWLLQLSQYIHLNPVEAGLVKKPAQYRWSSYPAYIGKSRPMDFLIRDEIYRQLNVAVRRKSYYRKFVEQKDVTDSIRDLYSKSRLPPVLGDDNFRAKCLAKLKRDKLHAETSRDELNALVHRPSVAEIVQQVAESFEVSEESIYLSKKGRGMRNTPRKAAMYLAQRLCGCRLTEIAVAFGLQHYGSVSYAIQAIKKDIEVDRKAGKKIKRIINRFDL